MTDDRDNARMMWFAAGARGKFEDFFAGWNAASYSRTEYERGQRYMREAVRAQAEPQHEWSDCCYSTALEIQRAIDGIPITNDEKEGGE